MQHMADELWKKIYVFLLHLTTNVDVPEETREYTEELEKEMGPFKEDA